ncbi:hypothetical protein EON68_03720, partial [archaeon]
ALRQLDMLMRARAVSSAPRFESTPHTIRGDAPSVRQAGTVGVSAAAGAAAGVTHATSASRPQARATLVLKTRGGAGAVSARRTPSLTPASPSVGAPHIEGDGAVGAVGAVGAARAHHLHTTTAGSPGAHGVQPARAPSRSPTTHGLDGGVHQVGVLESKEERDTPERVGAASGSSAIAVTARSQLPPPARAHHPSLPHVSGSMTAGRPTFSSLCALPDEESETAAGRASPRDAAHALSNMFTRVAEAQLFAGISNASEGGPDNEPLGGAGDVLTDYADDAGVPTDLAALEALILQRREELVRIMMERFCAGHDARWVSYDAIDTDAELDDAAEHEAEEWDAYFSDARAGEQDDDGAAQDDHSAVWEPLRRRGDASARVRASVDEEGVMHVE